LVHVTLLGAVWAEQYSPSLNSRVLAFRIGALPSHPAVASAIAL